MDICQPTWQKGCSGFYFMALFWVQDMCNVLFENMQFLFCLGVSNLETIVKGGGIFIEYYIPHVHTSLFLATKINF